MQQEFINLGAMVKSEAMGFVTESTPMGILEYRLARNKLRDVALCQWFSTLYVTGAQAQDELLLLQLELMQKHVQNPMSEQIAGTEPEILRYLGAIGNVGPHRQSLYGPYYTSMIAFTARTRLVLTRIIKLNDAIQYLDAITSVGVVGANDMAYAAGLRSIRREMLLTINWQDLEYYDQLFIRVGKMRGMWTDIEDEDYCLPDIQAIQDAEGTHWQDFMAMGVSLPYGIPRRSSDVACDDTRSGLRAGSGGLMASRPMFSPEAGQTDDPNAQRLDTQNASTRRVGLMTGRLLQSDSRTATSPNISDAPTKKRRATMIDGEDGTGSRKRVHGEVDDDVPYIWRADYWTSDRVSKPTGQYGKGDNLRGKLVDLCRTVGLPVEYCMIDEIVTQPPRTMKELLSNADRTAFANSFARGGVDLLEFIKRNKQNR